MPCMHACVCVCARVCVHGRLNRDMNMYCILSFTEDSGKYLISPEAVDVPPRYTDARRYPVRFGIHQLIECTDHHWWNKSVYDLLIN